MNKPVIERKVAQVLKSVPAMDGDGVRIERIASTSDRLMDPFLLIDKIRSDDSSDYVGGFPPHPHRGIETLTYMKKGGVIHEDNQGNRGEIISGGAQWMSAGRGVIHSEMPTLDQSSLFGFQLWINLPAVEKMKVADYRDVTASEIVHQNNEHYELRVIAGDWRIEFETLAGPLQSVSASAGVADLQLNSSQSITINTARTETLLICVYDGELDLNKRLVNAGSVAVTTKGDLLTVSAGESGAGVLLLKGKPINEPVVSYGPFVMNTEAEIQQAINDYRNGVFDVA